MHICDVILNRNLRASTPTYVEVYLLSIFLICLLEKNSHTVAQLMLHNCSIQIMCLICSVLYRYSLKWRKTLEWMQIYNVSGPINTTLCYHYDVDTSTNYKCMIVSVNGLENFCQINKIHFCEGRLIVIPSVVIYFQQSGFAQGLSTRLHECGRPEGVECTSVTFSVYGIAFWKWRE